MFAVLKSKHVATISDAVNVKTSGLPDDFRKLRAKPNEVFPTCGVETHDEPFISVSRICHDRWRMDEVGDTAVTVHQPSGQRDDELGRRTDRAKRQALPWRQTGRAKPLVQP